ncbi:transposase [Striga asiatica]|uniref:Transposase n=1 Tax=Striga asiatica TaxID=4170 RepID=A0A5A7QZK4_STRAF|nr:transposase [Striga asiatica]
MVASDFFLLFINHKGRFVTVDGYEAYYGDCVATVTGLDVDRLGYFDIEDEIKKLGYENWGRICYKHRTTREFKDITDDADVMDCLGQMQGNKRYVEIYVQTEHLKKSSGVAVCQQEIESRNRGVEAAEGSIPFGQAKVAEEEIMLRVRTWLGQGAGDGWDKVVLLFRDKRGP